MKQIKLTFVVIVLLGSITSNAAWARGGGGHGGGWGHGGYGYGYGGLGLGLGLGYGLGYYSGSYYSPYYAYPPAVVAVPVSPPVYIQQAPPINQQMPSGYWYYCNNPQGYYPYIKQCPNGWQQVEPTPPPPR